MKNIKYRFKTEQPGKDIWYIDEAKGFDIVSKYYYLANFPEFDVKKYLKNASLYKVVTFLTGFLIWLC